MPLLELRNDAMIIGHSALYPRAGDIARYCESFLSHGGNRFISEKSVLRGDVRLKPAAFIINDHRRQIEQSYFADGADPCPLSRWLAPGLRNNS